MISTLIRIDIRTKDRLHAQSLTHNTDGDPTETMDSIVRRALDHLEPGNVKKIDMSKM